MQWKRSKHKKCFPQEHWQPTLVIHSVRASPFLFAVVLQLESTRLPIGCSTPLSSSTALSIIIVSLHHNIVEFVNLLLSWLQKLGFVPPIHMLPCHCSWCFRLAEKHFMFASLELNIMLLPALLCMIGECSPRMDQSQIKLVWHVFGRPLRKQSSQKEMASTAQSFWRVDSS